MNAESPEDLIATFKNAALSVTKLYKTAVAVQAKTRSDGYQDCLDDLLAYLDKKRIGLSEGEAGLIRRWATERLEVRDSGSQGMESEDEQDKSESDKTEAIMSSPAMTRPSADALVRETTASTAAAAAAAAAAITTTQQTLPQSSPQQPAAAIHPPIATPPAAHTPRTTAVGHHEMAAPALDTFTFQSSLPYPYQDANLNMANLNLSDSHHHPRQGSSTTLSSSRGQKGRGSGRSGSRVGPLGRGAGMKRKLNFAELFDLGGANNVFSSGGKRSRHG